MHFISTYILPIMVVFSFFIIWMVGARGVTQIMGSPMGASIMSAKQVVAISAFFGVVGALLSGHIVSKTYENILFSDAARGASSATTKALFVFVATVFIWMYIARLKSSLFSFSYTVVSALVASFYFGLGYDAIHWFIVVKIAVTWLISPFFCYFLTIVIYRLFHHLISKKTDPILAVRRAGSMTLSLFVTTFFLIVIYSGFSISDTTPSLYASLAMACFIGVIFYIISIFSMKSVVVVETDDPGVAESNTENLIKPLALLIVFVLPFSLGANNVANGVGPLLLGSRIGVLDFPADFQSLGSFLMAGSAIFLLGLVVSGLRQIEEMGRKFTELTPMRSFSIITATSLTIMLGTGFGVPLSTFHTAAGGVLAFSCVTAPRGGAGSMAIGRFLESFFIPWFLTVPATVFTAGMLYLLSGIVFSG